MKLIEIKENEKIKDKYFPNERCYEIPKKVKICIDHYRYFCFNNHRGNCKVSTMESLQEALSANSEKTLDRLNELFTCVHKLTFFATFNDIHYINILKNQFTILYNLKVPIGYNGDYQYHCMFISNSYYHDRDEYLYRIEEEKIELIS